MLKAIFFGVRGSTPCCSPTNQRYGGNTSCVAIETIGGESILFDMGTGLRYFGETIDGAFVGAALVTHLHWDHVQGLPFFLPINRPGARLDVYGPPHDGQCLADSFATFMRPPYFPIHCDDLAGDVRFHDIDDGRFDIGDAVVTSRPVPHVGSTNGYRIDCGGSSIAYVSDHQEPPADPHHVDDAVLELCEGVDVLIHDAQFTPAEFADRVTWGHCTVRYALEVAHQAGARRLVLFHHDPGHDDDEVDRLLADARCVVSGLGLVRVDAAYEGLQLQVG